MELASFLLFAADNVGGRGDDPSGGGGVAVIVGISLLFLVTIAVAGWLLARRGRARRDVHDRQTHDRGRVGRL